MEKIAYVYIMASGFQVLYIGLTTTLPQRVRQHKTAAFPDSFTAQYNVHKLVYFERHGTMHSAITREKQLKRWSRVKKIQLIVRENPDWRDLSEEWGKPTKPFSGVLRAAENLGDA